ncbi:hypothetical protein TSAR_011112 [Trichomalopsis sarcophagae]|uniref:Uncharacterized protein n=1 Tax=Trichomalopsis sarcophagae TaxID=543379 RepID=A0A232F2S7_9HYME|nr:hypothetical protein TSAR_011112 [Trichomalopsis sarcophagae]
MCKPPYTWCTDLRHVHNKELRTKEGQGAPHLTTKYLETIASLDERRCFVYYRGACQIRRYATCKPLHWSNYPLIVTSIRQRGAVRKLEALDKREK